MSEVFPVSNHAISEHECSVILVNMLRGQDHRQAPEEEQDEVMQEGSVVVEIPVMKSVTQSHLAKCQRAASELAQNLDLSESVEGLAVNYARHCEEPAIYSRHPNTIAAACVYWACRAYGDEVKMTVSELSRSADISYNSVKNAVFSLEKILSEA